MKWLLITLFSFSLLANELNNITFESTLHYEYESINGHAVTLPSGVIKEYGDDEQSLGSFFTVMGYRFINEDDSYAFNLEARANFKLSKGEYKVPLYLDKYSFDDINKVMFTALSLDFYSAYGALTLGRNRVDMDWLYGSIDSIMFYHENSYLSARAFWFYNYYDFEVNYLTQFKKINDSRGVYGLYLQSGDAYESGELSLYYYFLENQRNLVGAKFSWYFNGDITFSSAYSYSKALADEGYDESYFRLWGEYCINESHSLNFGSSITGENGLYEMLQFGSHPFSEFYLGNEIARPKARNYYLSYSYIDEHFYVQNIYGASKYYDKLIDGFKLKKGWLNSQEIDLSIGLFIGNNMTAELSYMFEDVDAKDFLEFDKELIMFELRMIW